jgi:large subunit ribosomal protein L30
MRQVEITLVKSLINRPEIQKKTVRALGLTKLNSKASHKETPEIMGMIKKVSHLLKIEYK